MIINVKPSIKPSADFWNKNVLTKVVVETEDLGFSVINKKDSSKRIHENVITKQAFSQISV